MATTTLLVDRHRVADAARAVLGYAAKSAIKSGLGEERHDIAHDVYVILREKLGAEYATFEELIADWKIFKTTLYYKTLKRVVWRVLKRYYRSNQRRLLLEKEHIETQPMPNDRDGGEQAAQAELQEKLREVFGTLDDNERELLSERMEGKTFEEIGDRRGWNRQKAQREYEKVLNQVKARAIRKLGEG